MSLPESTAVEMRSLLGRLADGSMTASEQERLNEILAIDPQAQQMFADYAMLDVCLEMLGLDGDHSAAWVEATAESPWSAEDDDSNGPFLPPPSFSIHQQTVAPLPPIVIQAIPTPLSSFAGSALFSYLVAAVIVGIGLTIAAVWKLSSNAQVVQQSAPLPYPLSPLPSAVGRITGMVDCVWDTEGLGIRDWGLEGDEGRGARGGVRGSGFRGQGPDLPSPSGRGAGGEGGKRRLQSLIPNPQSLVCLGDRLALKSGLLELTYDTGARVILQGPVTYKVDSIAGGYLAIGKLTAKLEKRGGGRGTGDGEAVNRPSSSGHQPLATSHSPLFTVKTPTAVITDLGTEFGVEVAKEGRSEVHVLDGSVNVEFHDRQGHRLTALTLKAGEGRIHRSDSGQLEVIAADFEKFARPSENAYQRWKSYSRKLQNDPALVAYYTFEPHQGNTATLPNMTAAGGVLDAEIHNAEWVAGRLPGKLALLFRGEGSGSKVVVPKPERFAFTGPFSAAIWFNVERFTAKSWNPLAIKGPNCWRLHRMNNTNRLAFDTDLADSPGNALNILRSVTDVADGHWHLAVAVFDPVGGMATKRLYIDGRLEGECQTPSSLLQNDEPVWLGANSLHPDRTLDGRIDEAAFFSRALSSEEVQAMFDAGNPMREKPLKSKKQDAKR